ncbi:MAG: DUF4129 domain-containing protein [Planctomycetes bacterium]|nr:DUF4129 domain-containing protein [Planctomycetota bacterium]
MAKEREAPSLTDYVVTALSPALVMLMVGSLAFFLVEVLYAGKYSDRLLYTLFFFVSAAVLVARISIQYDRTRAAIYGLALAVVTYLALLSYVEYPKGWLNSWGWLVNLGLMAVIWWSAHKLTWDCTHLDENRASSGRGLLNAAGLDADEPAPVSREPQASAKPKKTKTVKRTEPDSKLWNWIERYKAHREAKRKAGHTPGVWVLYFALAALPLFALGQSLVDADDDKRRRATFLQMAVYVASALGLLVTTSLLGVRRYLRQRKAKVPAAMTVGWLGLGAVLIVGFVALAAFLPRPHSEVPWFGIERAGKSDRDASRYAQRGGSSGKGDGAAGSESKAGDGGASAKGGQSGGTKGTQGSGKGNDGKGGGGKKQEGKGAGDQKDDPESRESQSGANEQQGDDAKEEGGSRSGTSSSQPFGETFRAVAGALKWLVFALVALLVIFGLFFAVLKYLAPFTDWAKRWLAGLRAWWANLFRRAPSEGAGAMTAVAEPQGAVRPPPFSAYSNPFSDGTAEGRDIGELIAYSFEALDAWAHGRAAGRDPTETPFEFVLRLGEVFPDQEEEFARLALLYAHAVYSERPLPPDALAVLEGAWEQMVHGVAVGA